MREIPSLDHLSQEIWEKLIMAADPNGHPWHTPCIATTSGRHAHNRMVVLRAVKAGSRQLFFHSDLRAQKISDLQQHNNISWLFWDPQKGEQIRLRAQTVIRNQDELTAQHWESLDQATRSLYAHKHPPGYPLPPSHQGNSATEPSGSAEAYSHFAVVVTTVDYMDWLQLSETQHLRAQFHWNGENWEGQWVVP